MTHPSATAPQASEEQSTPLRLRHYPNAASAVVLFAVRVLVSVLQLRLVDKFWGGAYTGLNALSNQVLLYVTLLELGLSQSAISLMYEPILSRNFPRISAMVMALRHDVRRVTTMGAAVIFPVVALYAYFIHGALPFWTVAATLACIAATGLLQLTAVHFQVYLNAAEQLDKVNYTFAGGYLLKTLIGLPLAIHWHNYLLLPATIAALTIAEFFSLRFSFRRAFPQFHAVPWRDEARIIRNRAKYALIQRAAGLAYYQSDFIILSLTTSLVVVKDYAKFQYVAAALLGVVGLVASSLTTSVARLQIFHHAENRHRQYVTAQFAISLIGAVLMLSFWFTASTVVSLAFGHSAAIEQSSILLFGIALFLNIVKAVDDVFIMAKGRFEVGYWIPAVEVPIFVGTGVLLSRFIGFNGILLASIGTNLFVSILLKGIFLARPIFDSTRRQWYINRLLSMGKALVLLLPLVGVYWFAPKWLHPNGLRFVMTNAFALIYLLVGVRIIMAKTFRSEEQA